MGHKADSARLGNLAAALRAASTATVGDRDEAIQRKRELVADLCRLLGRRMARVTDPGGQNGGSGHNHQPQTPGIPAQLLDGLSPRMRQTLDGLLAGDSEKQIAHKLALSKHTVHVYVKALYKGFGVCSRGELLARFIRNTSA